MLERVNTIWNKIVAEEPKHPTITHNADAVTEGVVTNSQSLLQNLLLGEHKKLTHLRSVTSMLLHNITDVKKLKRLSDNERMKLLSFLHDMEKDSRNFELSVLELCAKNSWVEKILDSSINEPTIVEEEIIDIPTIPDERRKELTEMLRDAINEKARSSR